MGIAVDAKQNKSLGEAVDATAAGAKVRVLIIPTNEELMIAMDTAALLTRPGESKGD